MSGENASELAELVMLLMVWFMMWRMMVLLRGAWRKRKHNTKVPCSHTNAANVRGLFFEDSNGRMRRTVCMVEARKRETESLLTRMCPTKRCSPFNTHIQTHAHVPFPPFSTCTIVALHFASLHKMQKGQSVCTVVIVVVGHIKYVPMCEAYNVLLP